MTETAQDERFWAKVEDSGDCWVWLAGRNGDGYGRFRLTGGRVSVSAHRYAYEQMVGPIPDGLQLDHLCRNRGCVNPDHLEPVTPQVNVLRGVGRGGVYARRSHCIRGHEFTPENTRARDAGRVCIACERVRNEAKYAKRKRLK